MSVVQLARVNLADIPARLRDLSAEIEAGKWGEVKSAVIVLDDGEKIETFGYGGADTFTSLAMLTLALRKVGR